MRLAHLTAPVILLMVLSGCAGNKAPPPTDGPGRIEGRVLDDAANLLAGALAHILLTQLDAETDEAGFFTFPSVPSGPVRVVVSAPGYSSVTRDGVVQAGKTLELEFTLPSVRTVEPFDNTIAFDGMVACGLPAGADCSNAVPGSGNVHPFDVEPGLAGLVLELEWTAPGGGIAQDLAFDVLAATSTACGQKYAEASGPSVLKLVVPEGFPTSGGNQCAVVRPLDDATFQQNYKLYVTKFYHAPPPDDFTAVS